MSLKQIVSTTFQTTSYWWEQLISVAFSSWFLLASKSHSRFWPKKPHWYLGHHFKKRTRCGLWIPPKTYLYINIYIYYIRPKINTIRKSSVTWRKIPIENPRIIFDSQLPFHVTKQYRIHPEILGGFNSSCCCLDAPRTSLVMRWPSFGRRIDFYGGPFDVLSFFFKYVFENDNRWYNLHFCTSIYNFMFLYWITCLLMYDL